MFSPIVFLIPSCSGPQLTHSLMHPTNIWGKASMGQELGTLWLHLPSQTLVTTSLTQNQISP